MAEDFQCSSHAIVFNEDVYVGYIPHAPMMEISAVDPKLGGVFYPLDQVPQEKPSFTRSQDCLQCHVSWRTLGIPGHFVRSLQTDGSSEDSDPQFSRVSAGARRAIPEILRETKPSLPDYWRSVAARR